jgi:hypothetical protein
MRIEQMTSRVIFSSSSDQSCIIQRRLLVGFSGIYLVSELPDLFFECSGATGHFSVILLLVLIPMLGALSPFSTLT